MRRRLFAKLALALASALVGLVCFGEVGLRIWKPPVVRMFDTRFKGAPGNRVVKIDKSYEVHPEFGIFQLDDELGFRPVLGGEGYGPHGCKWNEYVLEKPPGKRRLLFIGDSVTERHKVIDALHELWGEDYEYWNAGVPAYATEQEYLYYRDYLGSIDADHVILTFHLNDYETTPIVFEVDSELVAVHSRLGHSSPSPWLLRNSFLYRWGWAMATRLFSQAREADLEAGVRTNLELLRDLVHARGADFTVLVLPWLLEPARWDESQRRHHEMTLDTLAALGVRHYSFMAELETALADGIEIHETKADPQHPSLEFARRMAQALEREGFRP